MGKNFKPKLKLSKKSILILFVFLSVLSVLFLWFYKTKFLYKPLYTPYSYLNLSQNLNSKKDSTKYTKITLTNLSFVLPANWTYTNIDGVVNIYPKNGGGYINIKSHYINNQDPKDFYCLKTNVCIKNTTYFTPFKIGNIMGSQANAIDNSGGGIDYFVVNKNTFYLVNTYNPPSPNDFEKDYEFILNSILF